MYEAIKSSVFDAWLSALDDPKGRARVLAKLRNMELGNLGDIDHVGDQVFESRIFYGPGYRLYFIREGQVLIVMLVGGDKGSQK